MRKPVDVLISMMELHKSDPAFEDTSVCMECGYIYPCNTMKLVREGIRSGR